MPTFYYVFFYYYVHLPSSAATSTDNSCSGNTAVVSCVSPTVPSSATWNEYVIIHHNAEKIPNSAKNSVFTGVIVKFSL